MPLRHKVLLCLRARTIKKINHEDSRYRFEIDFLKKIKLGWKARSRKIVPQPRGARRKNR